MLDFSSLKNAIASLNKGIKRASENKGDEELRDAVIQRFEYTYELSWKMLKRRIEQDHPNPQQVDEMSFHDLFREGGERGLVENVEKWFTYRKQRNITSHVYDRKKAESVYATALDFAVDAQNLLLRLENKCDD